MTNGFTGPTRLSQESCLIYGICEGVWGFFPCCNNPPQNPLAILGLQGSIQLCLFHSILPRPVPRFRTGLCLAWPLLAVKPVLSKPASGIFISLFCDLCSRSRSSTPAATPLPIYLNGVGNRICVLDERAQHRVARWSGASIRGTTSQTRFATRTATLCDFIGRSGATPCHGLRASG
ncbi:hypothetical protein P171DRAFT_477191 [Karstenula rhodostoma CBS 690.94]|uniref:Uncharacterized protein n=1 Tax=Karstenula rhodostoma CBS 690.94 TaxID=1392251 RepID=A0A9P4P7K9_9PLEO|nr:hypothetical protein P171DRAFT_477191 [Karstenula rhodostoma CBS 690.94]